MLAILDYRAGNLTSVKRALDFLQIPCEITSDPEKLHQAEGIIFPGVGAAGSAMENLQKNNMDQVLKKLIQKDKPLLGICLGCQIILEYSPENNTQTLGIIPGQCARFNPDWTDAGGLPINIPHMGWNKVHLEKECLLFKDVDKNAEFYFVHSYYPVPEPGFVIGTQVTGKNSARYMAGKASGLFNSIPKKAAGPV